MVEVERRNVWQDRFRVHLGKAALRSVRRSLASFPAENNPSRDTCDSFKLCSRSRGFRDLSFHPLADGVAITYTSDLGLADRSHRFIIPKDGDGVGYHHESFNVDCQAVPSPDVELAGIKSIGLNQTAYDELIFVRNSLKIIATGGWQLETLCTPYASC